tara:strand:- start:35502 stop:37217 length:1716 start_codon:yes stop_codon:yes gene_type:complete
MKNVINYILRSDGNEFAHTFKVKSISVLHSANRISRAKLILLDGDVSEQKFKLSDDDFFKPGKTLEIDVGFENDLNSIFTGVITRHSIRINEDNNTSLEVECKHKAVQLTLNLVNRFFYEQDDQEVVEEILNNENIVFSTSDWAGYVHSQLVQFESTNWDFILARAAANGLLVFNEKDRIVIKAPDMDGEEVAQCEYGVNVLEFEAAMNNELQIKKVERTAWSSEDQTVQSVEGTASFENTQGNLSTNDLADAWGDRTSLQQHGGELIAEELSAWSDAGATQKELSKIEGRVRITGTHAVIPGKVITLTGFGERFSGRTLVTGVRHELQKGNWTTDVQFGISSDAKSKNLMGMALARTLVPQVIGCQIGIVTQLEEDPESSFRVKVKLPILNEQEEGIWARIAQPYAGDSYGFCFYPEIGDEVVLGFLDDDPRNAIILGSLHSSGKPSPLDGADDNHIKGIHTRSGLILSWDDENKTIEIATPSGNSVTLDESDQKITIIDEHSNQIAMSSEGIVLESNKKVEIKASTDLSIEAVNIKLKASGKFVAEGSGGADLKSSGIAVLKGSMVQIN